MRQDYYTFSLDGKECLIHRRDTPVPWLNLLSNDRFVAWVTHNGNIIESCLINNKTNRLTNPRSGYFYIRDVGSGEYFMLNNPQNGAKWSAVQGLGYTAVSTSDLGLQVSATYFVPRDDDLLICLIRVQNQRSGKRTIDVFSLVEWSLGDPHYGYVFPGGDFYSIHNNFKRVEFENEVLFATNACYGVTVPGQFMGQKAWPCIGFLTSNLPVKGFECDPFTFFGRMGDVNNPEILQKDICTSQPAFGFTGFPLGVLHHSIQLAPGGEKKFAILLGITKERAAAQACREKYRDSHAVDQAFQNLKEFWAAYVDKSICVETPESKIDRLINIWIKYQHRASLLQNLNTQNRGFGIWCPAYPYGSGRNSDIRETGNVPCDLDIVAEDIRDYLQAASPLSLKSDTELTWQPEVVRRKPSPYPHNGRGLWPRPITWYVKETGDFSFLETPIDFKGQHPWAEAAGKGSIFECLKRSIAWAQSGLSQRNLPRLNPGFGDWDDAQNLISREGKGESVLTAVEICYMLKECAELAVRFGKAKQAEQWMQEYQAIKSAVNEYAWDGKWYIRAFTDEGTPVGSAKEKQGRISLAVQALAVLSGVADPERSKACLQSVDELLMTEIGPMLTGPPYTKPDYHIGIVTDFGPGWRENGGIWNRTTGWAVMANCVANRANQAFDMYKKASLSSISEDVNRFWLPPYAYPEYYIGAGPDFGRGQFQWCMGKAGTMWRAFVYYILGIRPDYDGLLIDPKIPAHWSGFKISRPFRGAFYQIVVQKPEGRSLGVKSIMVDNKEIEGNVVPPHSDGKTHTVKVILES